MKVKSFILVLAGLLSAASVCAQTFDALPYEYGFEVAEAAEQANWVLNPGTNTSRDSIDRWAIGPAISHADRQAMYISVDGGLTCSAGSISNEEIVQFAYRDFVLPSGRYYFTFDWLCPAMSLYAGYNTYVNINNSQQAQNVYEQLGSSVLPNVGMPSVGALQSDHWNNAQFTVTVKQPTNGQVRTVRVWFAWVNNQADSVQSGLSAVIDNIQLTKADCPLPKGLTGFVQDCDNVNFEWVGSSARYQFQFRPTGDTGRWRNRMVNNAETFITLQSMNEGNYDFRVRGICYGEDSITGLPDTTYSPYVYLTNFNIFCPELHCINYLSLTDTNWVVCTYGKSGSSYQGSENAPYQNTGVIDYGWDKKASRHTIIWDTTATDPRTNNMLRMVPVGTSASVRLGNWDDGNGAEAITYKYNVDADNSILLVNYAIVLEEPTGHGEDGVPRFVIKIKDEFGEIIDPTCGVVNLNSETKGGTGWTSTQYTEPGSSYADDIVFKDWTTLGLNLDQYVGQTIYISVETFDCFWGAHYGYAYFTMDCQTARIKNTSCGSQSSMTVYAPTGFKYAWYAGSEIRPRSTTQSIDIQATDPTDWHCTLTSTENENCSFDLEINTTARFPQAEFSIEYVPENCENKCKITNTSYVWTNEDGQRHEHREEVCDEYEWSFGKAGNEDDTNDPNPGYITFPEEGGTFFVTLTANLGQGGGPCTSDTTIRIYLPAIGDTHHVIDTMVCEGSFVEFHDRKYFETGTYTFVGKTKIGCYANDTLRLEVHPQDQSEMQDTTICYGDTVWLGDDYRIRDGVLKHTFTNVLGCDSLVIRPVHVMPHMMPSIDVQEIDEEHASGSITITIYPEDSVSYYTINGVKYTESTVLTGLVGGTFNITFYNRLDCTEEEVVRMCAYEVFQRWNDVVSLKNKDEIGGGEFIAYQWYNHDEPIEGATRSYYYKHGGFDGTELLYCLVTLPDSTQEQSCTFIPTVYDEEGNVKVSPTSMPAAAPMNVTVPEDATVTVYTSMGLPLITANLTKGTTTMRAPQQKGVYLVAITLDSGIYTERIVVE